MSPKIRAEHLERGAVVYVRQSTPGQIEDHRESFLRQHALADRAREMGFAMVETIDDDLGRSGSGFAERPGFQRLLGLVGSAKLGAVFALEASRLARNDLDWSRLVDLCAITAVLLVDHDGVYDPCITNDRLLLGLKGIMSQFETTTFRMRANEAKRQKAARGELHIALPVGLVYAPSGAIELDPDARVREAIDLVFAKFRELGAVRQVMRWFRAEQVELPSARVSKAEGGRVEWAVPHYVRVHEILTNPMLAGAYAYGRTGYRTVIVDEKVKRTSGHEKPIEEWDVLIEDHHDGYITWNEYLANTATLRENAHMKPSGRKAARGGRSLLAGLLHCRQCGHKLRVSYSGRNNATPYFRCMRRQIAEGADFCISFSGTRFDEAISAEVLRVVESNSIEAAIEAASHADEKRCAQRRALELELEEARYEAHLAERRHERVDPDQRLVAAELEARWNKALERVASLSKRLADFDAASTERAEIRRDELMALAVDLPALWADAATDMRLKQRIVRILIQEILVDVDEQKNELLFVLHWVGGRHSELPLVKNMQARPSDRTDDDVVRVVRQMAGRWRDEDIAAALNRIGCRTPTGKTWTAPRVREKRSRMKLPPYDPSLRDGALITCAEAAKRLGLSTQYVGQLLARGVIPGTRAAPGLQWDVPAAALDTPELREKLRDLRERRRGMSEPEKRNLTIPGL
jgi:excisionase family DNA binding protein